MERDMKLERKINYALTSAVVYVDTAYGGDGANESGLYRVILDAHFTRLDSLQSNPVYKDGNAKGIRKRAHDGQDFSKQAKDWIEGDWSEMLDVLKGTINAVENPRRRRYLENQEKSLSTLLRMKKAELGCGKKPPYRELVKDCVGMEPEIVDIKHMRALLGEELETLGYKQENLHEALDAWSKDQKILTSDEIGRHIRAAISPLERTVRKNIMPLLPQQLQNLPLKNINLKGLKDAFFSASNNYLGGDGFTSGYEYNMKIRKSEPELFTMTMHEFLPGHHFQSAVNQASWERGIAGAEQAITTMGTPQTALAEGIAVAAPYTMIKCGDPLSREHRIAMFRDQLDATGRLNGSILYLQKGKSLEKVKGYVREECCFSEEWASRYTEKWLKNPFLGAIYAPGYGLGNKTVKEGLMLLPIEEFIPLLYGVEGPMDLITFREAVKEKRL